MDFKEQLLKELREDRGFLYKLQRELEIDDIQSNLDEIDRQSLSKNYKICPKLIN